MNDERVAAGELLLLSGRPSQPSPINVAEDAQQSHKKVRGSTNARSNPCHICGKSYERLDHLNRHLKSHDNARPFQCTRCAKGFNRADLLHRHKTTHDSNDQMSVKRALSNRAVQACKACAASKSKCEDQKPCFRCQDRRITCEYPEVAPPQYDSELEALSTHFDDDFIPQSQTQPAPPMKDRLHSEATQRVSDHEIHLPMQEQMQHMLDVQNPLQPVLEQREIAESRRISPMNPNATPFSNDSNLTISFDWQGNMFFPIDVANFGQDLDFQFPNFDLDATQYTRSLLPAVVKDEAADESGIVTLRHEAFKRSPWFWAPTSKDYVYARQGEVLAIAEHNTVSSPDFILSLNSKVVDERVDQAARDRVFALVIAESHRVAPVLSFPSAELLDNLLQIFFIRDSYQHDRFIHVPTFKTSKVIPELLISIIAAGSTFISDPVIWKMGLALQEVARMAVGSRIESNNSSTRDLATLQAHMLWIDVGSWSGFNRLMEIAEACEQPPLTMLRRAGALNRTRYPVIRPEPHDTGDVLETKWTTWVKHESFKRLVLHLFMHDMQNSIANLVNPLISYVEMTLPLPASHKLWSAKTAEEWKSVILEMKDVCHGQTPSLSDSLHDILPLELSRDHIDVQMSSLAILFGHWGQIWTYDESRQFLSKGSKPTSQLRLTSQQQELFQDLQTFCASIKQITDVSAFFNMVSELLMMSMYVSIAELQRFAGKSGEEEAWRVYPIIRDWIESADARHAAWHAGQVLRAAREIPPTQLRGFYAIGLYHASLTLWAYGLASLAARKRGTKDSSTAAPLNNTVPVPLDGTESPDSRAFLHFGQGSPGLTIQPSNDSPQPDFGSLENSRALMSIASQILRSNFPLTDERLPPLVQNIRNLMKDLGDLATVPNLRSEQAGHG